MNTSLGLNVSALTNTLSEGIPSCFNIQESGGGSRSTHIHVLYNLST